MRIPSTPPRRRPSILEGGEAPPARFERLPTVLVAYATLTGHTAKVAERLGRALNSAGYLCDVLNVEHFRPEESLQQYAGVVLCADVRRGRLDVMALRFARERAQALSERPGLLVSVGLEAASPKEASRTAAQAHLADFCAHSGWQPELAEAIAGLLAYRQAGWLTRWMMRKVAEALGLSTDTAQNHEYTDWAALDALAQRFAALLPAPPPIALP